MMSTPDDVMVLISRASVVGFGVSVWRDRKRKEEEVGGEQRTKWKFFFAERTEGKNGIY